ncbi:hypothetical protein [Nannocystis pusilla]|uniref:Uncharacterized protein n=1 Tax=Nannocystis pusilla TaxID=889268 RepID=A0ABS7TP66_9BACT|nr:hypothetical protein [Nannocystis pusilla]MBZ5710000.1 hypothetical protein [Nannocystis pusilla]
MTALRQMTRQSATDVPCADDTDLHVDSFESLVCSIGREPCKATSGFTSWESAGSIERAGRRTGGGSAMHARLLKHVDMDMSEEICE